MERCPQTEAQLNDPANRYLRWRQLADGTYIAVGELMFTRALFVGVNPWSFERRYCFADRHLADEQFDLLQSGEDEPQGWIARRPETLEDLEKKNRPPE